jgi:hypothetical protein
MDWIRRLRNAGLGLALLLALVAGPAWAGTVSGSGMVTAKSSTPQTLVVDDQVTVRITPDTQLVDPAGNPVAFADIPVGGPAGQVLVDYRGIQAGSGVVADRVVVTVVTE